MKTDLEIMAAPRFLTNGFEFLIKQKSMNENSQVATGLIMQKHKQGMHLEPTFRLDREQAQVLFDQLWQMGLRPQDGTGNSGHVAAINYHLEDMRRLVFKCAEKQVKAAKCPSDMAEAVQKTENNEITRS